VWNGKNLWLFNGVIQHHLQNLSGCHPDSRGHEATDVNGEEDQGLFHLHAGYPVSHSLMFLSSRKMANLVSYRGCICGAISTYYWVVWARSSDKTYRLGAALLASVVELNVGIVVGCMPVIQPALFSRFAELYRLSFFQSLTSRFFKPNRTPVSCGQYQEERPYLETRILHGANGEGKFMSSVQAPVRIQRSLPSPSRSAFSARTSWRNHIVNNINNTAIGTQISDQSMMMATSISSACHSNINQDRDPNLQYMLQVERIRNMV
jgi:hypothetical protein